MSRISRAASSLLQGGIYRVVVTTQHPGTAQSLLRVAQCRRQPVPFLDEGEEHDVRRVHRSSGGRAFIP